MILVDHSGFRANMSTKKQFEDADGPKDGRKPAVDDKKKAQKNTTKKTTMTAATKNPFGTKASIVAWATDVLCNHVIAIESD